MFALPYDYYQACVLAGEIREDPAQEKVVRALHELAENIRDLARPPLLPWLAPKTTRGLYIYGTVGRGKTMLMDIFFQSINGVTKRRTHFHAFMAEVHERLHGYREKGQGDGALLRLAREIAKESRLICFDEFQVYNIADAMILGRLFQFLFRMGVVIVATSNTAPDDLYKDGLQRDLFLPAIALIKKSLRIVEMENGQDYRQARLKGLPVYLVPHNNQSYVALQRIFKELTDHAHPESRMLTINGRAFLVPKTAKQVAWFSYADLCQQPLSANDFLKLAEKFHTFIVEDVPLMVEERRDETLRFIHLVDVLYEKHSILIISAAAQPEKLLPLSSMLAGQFARTASRLSEMQSQEYLMAPHTALGSARPKAGNP